MTNDIPERFIDEWTEEEQRAENFSRLLNDDQLLKLAWATNQRHVPREENGELVCDRCTVLENRIIGDHLVRMLWGEGDCPGAAE